MMLIGQDEIRNPLISLVSIFILLILKAPSTLDIAFYCRILVFFSLSCTTANYSLMLYACCGIFAVLYGNPINFNECSI